MGWWLDCLRTLGGVTMQEQLEERGRYQVTLCDKEGAKLFSKTIVAHRRMHLPPLSKQSKGYYYRVMTPSGKELIVGADDLRN